MSLGAGSALAQDAENGEQVFRQCRACHQIGDNAKNLVGPQLNNVIGRTAGTAEGFKYSNVNIEAGKKGLVWNPETLDKYLEAPLQFMPGTRMAFAGLPDDDQRKDVIAYLKKFSK
jgi:cytochrome c